jgi:hypothetical protein
MPQASLPLFTSGMTVINLHSGVQKCDGKVYYFEGFFPFYHHREDDRESFKHVVCQMISNGRATCVQISKAFHIPERSISRWMDVFEKEGPGCFFRKKTSHVRISTPETVEKNHPSAKKFFPVL